MLAKINVVMTSFRPLGVEEEPPGKHQLASRHGDVLATFTPLLLTHRLPPPFPQEIRNRKTATRPSSFARSLCATHGGHKCVFRMTLLMSCMSDGPPLHGSLYGSAHDRTIHAPSREDRYVCRRRPFQEMRGNAPPRASPISDGCSSATPKRHIVRVCVAQMFVSPLHASR